MGIEAEDSVGAARFDAKPRLGSIQVVRAAAALSVVLFHTNVVFGPTQLIRGTDLGRVFAWGHSGVDIFFVLSGFIIPLIHFDDDPGRRGAIRYAVKRTTRLYPFVIGTVAVFALAAPLFQFVTKDPGFLAVSLGVMFSSFTLLPVGCDYMPGVLWSLVNEMSFYAVFLLVFVSHRAFFAGLALWSAAILAANFAKLFPGLTSCSSSPLALYNLLFPIGVSIFGAYRVFRHRLQPHWAIRLFAAGLLTYLSAALIDYHYLSQSYFVADSSPHTAIKAVTRLLYGLAGAQIVLCAAISRWVPRTAVARGAVVLGDASFIIYLVHQPLIGLFGRLAVAIGAIGVIGPIPLFATIALTVTALGVAVHWLIERPALSAIHRQVQKRF